MKRLTAEDIAREKQQRQEARQARATQVSQPSDDQLPFELAVGQLSNALAEASRRSPCFQAWRLLQRDDDEQSSLLSAAAERAFEDLQAADPQDPLIWHHLAIIRHGRAIQLHIADQTCDEALWQQGLEAWSKVVESDRFWQLLRSRWHARLAQKPHDTLLQRLQKVDLESIRRRVPEELLRLHMEIVADVLENQFEMARTHFRLLCSAPFDDHLKDKVKATLYQKLVGDLNKVEFTEALRRIESYLSLDPHNQRAQSAAMRIAVEAAESLLELRSNPQALAALESVERFVSAIPGGVEDEEGLASGMVRKYWFLYARSALRTAQAIPNSHAPSALEIYERAYRYSEQAEAHGTPPDELRNLRLVLVHDGGITALNAYDVPAADRMIERGMQCDPDDEGLGNLIDQRLAFGPDDFDP